MTSEMASFQVPKSWVGKTYGSIPHLPGSRLGSGDHRIDERLAQICTTATRDGHDRVIVEEKLDGSNVAVARIEGVLVPLVRSGCPAVSSPYLQHRWFDAWVWEHQEAFLAVLGEGERLCGEWLAQAHGTRYALRHDPFVALDVMAGSVRLPRDEFKNRLAGRFVIPHVLHDGGAFSVAQAVTALADLQGRSPHGAVDPIEGAVWRVERDGVVEFLAKWVRPDKVDGLYLGREPVWNWLPLGASTNHDTHDFVSLS